MEWQASRHRAAEDCHRWNPRILELVGPLVAVGALPLACHCLSQRHESLVLETAFASGRTVMVPERCLGLSTCQRLLGFWGTSPPTSSQGVGASWCRLLGFSGTPPPTSSQGVGASWCRLLGFWGTSPPTSSQGVGASWCRLLGFWGTPPPHHWQPGVGASWRRLLGCWRTPPPHKLHTYHGGRAF